MTVALSAIEARILGSLIEKAATTPDSYPLSTNALRLACNQISNRDPVVDYDDRLIDSTMLVLRQRGLARTVNQAGSRVGKHRHVVDEALGLSPDELAVLAVLLLRGAQTVAELTTRTERYAGGPVGTTGVEAAIDRLAFGADPLVIRLGRRVGEREPRVGHLLSEDETPETTAARTGTGAPAAPGPVTREIAAGGVLGGGTGPERPPSRVQPIFGGHGDGDLRPSRRSGGLGQGGSGGGGPTAPTAAPSSTAGLGPGAVSADTAPGAIRSASAPTGPTSAPVRPGEGADRPAGGGALGGAGAADGVLALLVTEVERLRQRVDTLEEALAEQTDRVERLVAELGG